MSGTTTDTLAHATRTWVAPENAANLSAALAANWSPSGAPVSGDTLNMPTGIMNVAGNDLQNDVLHVGAADTSANVTLNLTDQAEVSLESAPVADTSVFVNVNGPAFVDLNSDQGAAIYSFNLDPNASVETTSIDLIRAALNMQGGMAFLNTGDVDLHASTMSLNTDVEGTGRMLVASDQGGESHVEFFKSVSSGQTIDVMGSSEVKMASSIRIDDPASFAGTVQLDFGKAALAGVQADSYDFKNDLLSLYRDGNVVDTLKLASPPFARFEQPVAVYATNTGVLIDNSGLGGTHGVALPVHV